MLRFIVSVLLIISFAMTISGQDETDDFFENCDPVELPTDIALEATPSTIAHHITWTDENRELAYDYVDGEFVVQFPAEWRQIPDSIGYSFTSDADNRIQAIADVTADDEQVVLLLRPTYTVSTWTGYSDSNPPDILLGALNENIAAIACVANIADRGFVVRYDGEAFGTEDAEIELIAFDDGVGTSMAQVVGDYDAHQDEILAILASITYEEPQIVVSGDERLALRLPASWVVEIGEGGFITVSDKAETIENFASEAGFGDDDNFILTFDASLGDVLREGRTTDELDTLVFYQSAIAEQFGVEFPFAPSRLGVGICRGDDLQFHMLAHNAVSPFDEEEQIVVAAILEQSSDGMFTGNAIGMFLQTHPDVREASFAFDMLDDIVPEIQFMPENGAFVSQAC